MGDYVSLAVSVAAPVIFAMGFLCGYKVALGIFMRAMKSATRKKLEWLK